MIFTRAATLNSGFLVSPCSDKASSTNESKKITNATKSWLDHSHKNIPKQWLWPVIDDTHQMLAKIGRGPSAWHHYDRHLVARVIIGSWIKVNVSISGPKVVPLSIRSVCSQKKQNKTLLCKAEAPTHKKSLYSQPGNDHRKSQKNRTDPAIDCRFILGTIVGHHKRING